MHPGSFERRLGLNQPLYGSDRHKLAPVRSLPCRSNRSPNFTNLLFVAMRMDRDDQEHFVAVDRSDEGMVCGSRAEIVA